MEHYPIVCKDPLAPFDVGTIAFTTMQFYHKWAPFKLAPLIERLSDGITWTPVLPAPLHNLISIRVWGTHGQKAYSNGNPHRMYHAFVRVCAKEPVTRRQAGQILLSLSQNLLYFPDRYTFHPLVMQLGVTCNTMGLPVYSEAALKMALLSMRVFIAPNTQQEALEEMGRLVHIAPQKTPGTLIHGVFSQDELKSCLPKGIFNRFFNQTPYVCGWKVGKEPMCEKWAVTINPEGSTHNDDGTKNPPTLQDLARVGVVGACLKMKRRGLGPRRYRPYDAK